jgi:hypothetical protein
VLSVWNEESRIESLKINFVMDKGFEVDAAPWTFSWTLRQLTNSLTHGAESMIAPAFYGTGELITATRAYLNVMNPVYILLLSFFKIRFNSILTNVFVWSDSIGSVGWFNEQWSWSDVKQVTWRMDSYNHHTRRSFFVWQRMSMKLELWKDNTVDRI